MATETALASITLAIQSMLQHAIDQAPDLAADVVSDHPDSVRAAGGAKVNVFLYLGQINPFLRNDDIEPQIKRDPKTGKAKLIQRWVTPLVINYLISFYGDEKSLIPQRLMAECIATLHRQPKIEAKALAKIAQTQFPNAAPRPVQDFEDVQIEMVSQSLDDIHRLWSALRAPYALSTLYQARSALIQSDPQSNTAWMVEELDIHSKAKPRT